MVPIAAPASSTLAFVGTGALVATSVAAAAVPEHLRCGARRALDRPVPRRHRRHAVGLRPRRVAQPHRADHHPGAVLPRRRGRTPPDPPRARIATAVEVVAVVAAASIRPYSEVAFGILAPMFGLGLMGMWGGRYGAFPPRPLKNRA